MSELAINGAAPPVPPARAARLATAPHHRPAAIPGDRVTIAMPLVARPDGVDLAKRFTQVVQDYQAGGGRIRNSVSTYGTVALGRHLFYHGAQFGENRTIPRTHTTGDEWRLKRLIEQEVASNGGRRLGPADIFRLSLGLSRGDVFKAVLTAQNALRALARGWEPDYGSQAPADSPDRAAFGVKQERDFFRIHLQRIREPLRGPTDPDPARLRSDAEFSRESGAWYHIFCTAAIAMKAGGPATRAAVWFEEVHVVAKTGSRRDPREHEYDSLGREMGQLLTRLAAAN